MLIPMGAKRIGAGMRCPKSSAAPEAGQRLEAARPRDKFGGERLTGEVASVRVDEHARDDAPSVKGLSGVTQRMSGSEERDKEGWMQTCLPCPSSRAQR